MRTAKLAMAAVCSMAMMAGMAFSQITGTDTGAAPGDRGDRGGRGDRGTRWDPAQMIARAIDRYQERIGATPEEWAALRPMVEKVFTLRQQAEGGGGGRRAGATGEAQAQEPDITVKKRELREALENPNATEQEVKTKLAAYLESRAKAREELTKARAELKELLTPKQEATLTVDGLL